MDESAQSDGLDTSFEVEDVEDGVKEKVENAKTEMETTKHDVSTAQELMKHVKNI